MKIHRLHIAVATTLICYLLSATCAKAQVAGLNTLGVLQMPTSARTAALGMDYLSIYAPADLQAGLDNPSLVNKEYHNRLALNYVGMAPGSNFGSVAYGRDFSGLGTFLFKLDFFSYGRFEGYDEMEIPQGDFYASDLAVAVLWGLNVDSNFSVGASLRPVFSQYESYFAFSLSLNVAGTYVSNDKRFAATLQARNMGAQLVTFNGNVEHLPFDLSATMSYKVSNAPFRLYLALNELTRWKLAYDDELNPTRNVDPYTGEEIPAPWYEGISDFFGSVGRHVSLGVELDLGGHFYARAGYRYRQMAEMAAADRTSINLSGFSYGFGLRTKRFEFGFARRNYHLGQAPNHLTLMFKF